MNESYEPVAERDAIIARIGQLLDGAPAGEAALGTLVSLACSRADELAEALSVGIPGTELGASWDALAESVRALLEHTIVRVIREASRLGVAGVPETVLFDLISCRFETACNCVDLAAIKDSALPALQVGLETLAEHEWVRANRQLEALFLPQLS